MLPGHHLSGTKILKNERARKIIRIFSNFLMRETINAISVARVRLAAVAKEKVYLLAFFFFLLDIVSILVQFILKSVVNCKLHC